MDEETIKKSLASLSPETLFFAQQYALIGKQIAEFERQAITIQGRYGLNGAYTTHEVMEACKEVCTHYPVPGMRTMGILAHGGNRQVIRDLIRELAKLE